MTYNENGAEYVYGMPTVDGSELLAIVVRADSRHVSTRFFTDPQHTFQLGVVRKAAGDVIPPHYHPDVPRPEVRRTHEVLFVRSGFLRVYFYDSHHDLVDKTLLGKGDAVLFLGGGHGFRAEEDCDLLEVKQGPYLADRDKVPVPPARLTLFDPDPDRPADA